MRGVSSETPISIEKTWHGLHYLLAGDPWGGDGPRAFLLGGGVEQGEDLGYGPARYFTAEEVRAISAELAAIDPDDLWSKFDAQQMTAADIYPNIWDEPADELQEEYLDVFEQLQEFLAAAAEAGDALNIILE